MSARNVFLPFPTSSTRYKVITVLPGGTTLTKAHKVLVPLCPVLLQTCCQPSLSHAHVPPEAFTTSLLEELRGLLIGVAQDFRSPTELTAGVVINPRLQLPSTSLSTKPPRRGKHSAARPLQRTAIPVE